MAGAACTIFGAWRGCGTMRRGAGADETAWPPGTKPGGRDPGWDVAGAGADVMGAAATGAETGAGAVLTGGAAVGASVGAGRAGGGAAATTGRGGGAALTTGGAGGAGRRAAC
jgi:hypothetical protein